MGSKRGVMSVLLMATSVLFLVASATVAEESKPSPTAPNLVGTWKGEWGGHGAHPITLVVEKQDGDKVSGKVMMPSGTYSVSGTIEARRDGTLWANLIVASGRTPWDFPLKFVSEKRLEGTGRSPRHFGPVILDRE